MNLTQHDATAAASTERKTWINPVLEEFDVETVTEAFDNFGADFGLLS